MGQLPMQVMHGLSCATLELTSPNTGPESTMVPKSLLSQNYLGMQGWSLRSEGRIPVPQCLTTPIPPSTTHTV